MIDNLYIKYAHSSIQHTVYPKILVVLNLVICLKSGRNVLLAEFKFGGLLRYIIAQLSLYAI